MTLDEFRTTGRDCADLGAALDDSYWEDAAVPARGRLYLTGRLWIERRPESGWPNGSSEEWFLLIGREDWLSDDLPRLEALLYEYALAEGLFDGAVR